MFGKAVLAVPGLDPGIVPAIHAVEQGNKLRATPCCEAA